MARKVWIEQNEGARTVRVGLTDPEEEVARADYDSHGWEGLELLESVARTLAAGLGADVESREPREGER